MCNLQCVTGSMLLGASSFICEPSGAFWLAQQTCAPFSPPLPATGFPDVSMDVQNLVTQSAANAAAQIRRHALANTTTPQTGWRLAIMVAWPQIRYSMDGLKWWMTSSVAPATNIMALTRNFVADSSGRITMIGGMSQHSQNAPFSLPNNDVWQSSEDFQEWSELSSDTRFPTDPNGWSQYPPVCTVPGHSDWLSSLLRGDKLAYKRIRSVASICIAVPTMEPSVSLRTKFPAHLRLRGCTTICSL